MEPVHFAIVRYLGPELPDERARHRSAAVALRRQQRRVRRARPRQPG